MTAPAANTPYAILSDAYLDAGRRQEGQVISSERIVDGMKRLTDIVNYEQTQGLKLWLQADTSVTLVSGTRDYTVTVSSTKPLRILQGYYLDSSDVSRPIYPLSWDEWLRLSTRTEEGQITQFFVDKQATALVVSFWLTPDDTAAEGTAHLLLQRQVTNPISVVETMEFPIEWRSFLRWAVADELATGQPQAIMDRCEKRKEMFRQALEAWDVEDASTSFQPDSRYGGAQSSFR